MFDVMLDAAIKHAGAEPIAEIVYTVLLRQLDYPEDFTLAELEIGLEGEGKLPAFEQAIHDRYAEELGLQEHTPHEVWRNVRKRARSINRASYALYDMDPNTNPTPDSYLIAARNREPDVSVRLVVERAYDLMARRRPKAGLVLIIDEVGQYVGRTSDKIENLRALVEQFGQVGRNRVRAGLAPAPAWLVVTSQEKLDEVVAALDSRRVELAKLQDRFRYQVDLAPADIKTVATKRVLGKTKEGEKILGELFAVNEGQINTHVRLDQTARRAAVKPDEFVQYYPYLPHFIDLSIDIVSGIRLQPGAPKHIGGSNRTIIKQAYEMLVSDRTDLADKPVGNLVTLDLIYELVEGNLSTEKRRDIDDIRNRFGQDSWAEKTAKAIALLEFVRDLPRSVENLAALLFPRLGEPSVKKHVGDALKQLEEHQYIRKADDGYKLQTQQEKSWETDRTSIDPSPRERGQILREAIHDVAEAEIRPYRHSGTRTFRAGITVDRSAIGINGEIPVDIQTADDSADAGDIRGELIRESRESANKDKIYWIVTLNNAVNDLLIDHVRSGKMIARYEQIRANGSMNTQDSALLADEKQRLIDIERKLQRAVASAIASGEVLFRGLDRHVSEFGDSLGSAMNGVLSWTIPELYPKLELGAHAVKGDEAEAILKAANLNALPQIFYSPPNGLGLVTTDASGRGAINENAEIALEVLNYLKSETSYGNKVTGRMLQDKFTGLGYGWDADVLRVVLAALLRGGAIEVTYQGRRYRNHLDPLVRPPFTSVQAFRSASFAPREKISLQTLIEAIKKLEQLVGEEVDVEEDAIASRLKTFAQQEIAAIDPIEAKIVANRLPASEKLTEYRDTLRTIIEAPSDDCVRILAGEGQTLLDEREHARSIREALSDASLSAILRGRDVLRQLWPELQRRNPDSEEAEAARKLDELFQDDSLYAHRDEVVTLAAIIRDRYEQLYAGLHRGRAGLYAVAIDEIAHRTEWQLLIPSNDAPADDKRIAQEQREAILADLRSRTCDADQIDPASYRCAACHTGLGQLESDLNAVGGLRQRAIEQLWQTVEPEPADVPARRVRVTDLARGPISTEEELQDFINRLRDEVVSLLSTGGRVILE